jgi:hypothetical protein
MTSDRAPAGHPTVRRSAIWPWLVMPVVILALAAFLHFAVLHNVRPAGAGDQDSSFGSGMP